MGSGRKPSVCTAANQALRGFAATRHCGYYTPVISINQRHLQALSLIIYEAMKLNQRAGRVIWNWGSNGNSLDSVYRFKKGWLASDYPYNYFIKSNIEWFTELDKKEILREYNGFYLFPFEQSQKLN